ncbi:SRPBCC family protein [Sphingomonas faeni]|uniref:SRPBCC family protein n=1 Tax=Sphingomonas faeni TaxID=185950 RepID=UPI00335FA7BD
MKFVGEYRIDASRDAVWRALNDPEVLSRCLPGCEEIVQNTPTDWQARVVIRVGPVRAKFAGRIRLEDLDAPESCRIVGEGSGGAAGFAQGGAVVRLVEEGAATILTYEAEAQIGGKLAQIGSRLIDGFAKRYADDFFGAFARVVGGEETPIEPTGAAQPLDPAPSLNGDGLGATAVLAAGADVAPPHVAAGPAPSTSGAAAAPTRLPTHPPSYSDQPRRGFDPQTFTIIILALLLVFMTIMFAFRP